MRLSTVFTSVLALMPFGASALQNKQGPFNLALRKDSVEAMKGGALGEIDAAIFNGLAGPIRGVLTDVGDIVINVLDLLQEVVGSVFYITEDGVLFLEGQDPSTGISGFSLNEQDELLYQGEQLFGGFDPSGFKLANKNTKGNTKRGILDDALNNLLQNVNLNLFVPVTVNALDVNPSAPSQ